ncbi:hypothetical protein H310_11500 [Aphanomyces invadans]|uniref:Mitochondrial import inner membrane translocase subunit TIM22 n=1 Tax=Aphanomyces invadans TaxID=157072 RepID=A0A024TLG0_9STRA|nr:hypothetical protein H310_11500 [Aphanomyces invadans]ETV94834.1 hypothetical protein H310_11500 [Aphanomyces invadans]|eukprot:XP_008876425.1 hypothetical protein H310_11500 [Aphanomyces invadans]
MDDGRASPPAESSQFILPYTHNPFVFPYKPPNDVGKEAPTFFPMYPGETCVSKVILSSVIGYTLGVAMGGLLSSYEAIAPPIPVPGQRVMPKVPFRESLQASRRLISEKSFSWGRNFLIFSAMTSGLECLVSKGRGRHDTTSVALAGCATGATLAMGQGPMMQCGSCVLLAAFSAGMEQFMHND